MSTIGIIQPNYIPWRGYFDFVRDVDIFVFLDDVQYTKRDWRTRNKIRTRDGKTLWLTIPVAGGRDQLIKDVRIDHTQKWARKHLAALQHSYGKTPFFADYYDDLAGCYEPGKYELLADFTIATTQLIASWLGIETRFALASEMQLDGTKDDRLLAIVQTLAGDSYLSGPAAADYIRPQLWADAGVRLAYKDYSGYPDYEQIAQPFEPAVSVLDLLFMKGAAAPDYIWGAHRVVASDTD